MRTVIPLPPPDPALRLSTAVCLVLLPAVVLLFGLAALSTLVTY